jgi:hypothetical protein
MRCCFQKLGLLSSIVAGIGCSWAMFDGMLVRLHSRLGVQIGQITAPHSRRSEG